ncbi:glycosyltransferase [Pyrobaculum ferrireducens]|uniref:Glycosyltransferase (Type 1) n=1 Tax=Pyrobaculum ferrireducens TaxID=1104324 RepID=G7VI06_9CREN|nr:glycosyltransferase [Pyrobaculum ferrireducens]AET33366.1 glycosyltransferase (type 1) [Pyrobaculum ferrireducens]
MDPPDAAYLTPFDVKIFARPIFFARALGIPVYLIRTVFGHLLNPNKYRTSGLATRDATVLDEATRTRIRDIGLKAIRLDPSRFISSCYRQDKTYNLSAIAKELSILPYIDKIPYSTIIIKNLVGVLAARWAGRRVVVDLMDLWHCDREDVAFNAVDFAAFRRADCVIAWSRAIQTLLKSYGLKCVEYLPFGIDLEVFDPLKAPKNLIYEKYPQLEGKTIIGYSGGGHWYHGTYKLITAFKLIEKRHRDVVLAIQTWGQNKLIKSLIEKVGVRNYVLVQPTSFNDPLRLSMLRASDVLVLTASRYPTVYLSERSTLFNYMAAGNAIVAEATPGSLGVLRYGENALLSKFNDVVNLATQIERLIKDESLRYELGANVRKDLETKYSWDVLKIKIRIIFEKLNRYT